MQFVVHVDLVVRSIELAMQFYGNLLDLSVADDGIVEGPVVEYLSGNQSFRMRLVLLKVAPAGSMIELIEFLQPVIPVPTDPFRNRTSISVFVGNLVPVLQRAAEHGLYPESEVMSVWLPKTGQHEIVFFRDPDGYLLELVGRPPAEKSREKNTAMK